MSSGERPIGAAKGKQSDTEALCQPPPPLSPLLILCRGITCAGGNSAGAFSSATNDVPILYGEQKRVRVKSRTINTRADRAMGTAVGQKAPKRVQARGGGGVLRPTERSDPTQHAKGRTGDCPGPRKETTTRRNVTQGGWTPRHPPHPLKGAVLVGHGRGRGTDASRTRQQPAHPQYTNYWAPLTRKRHSPGTPTTGLRERGNDTSRSTGRSGRQNAATRRNMRREERVTVQGPVKKQQPDGMSHGGVLPLVLWCAAILLRPCPTPHQPPRTPSPSAEGGKGLQIQTSPRVAALLAGVLRRGSDGVLPPHDDQRAASVLPSRVELGCGP